MKHKITTTYEVTLRRDVQLVRRLHIEAYSREDAINVASSTDPVGWEIEKVLGEHRPQIKSLRDSPIRGRATGKPDRRHRDGTDRRATKRRLDDKSRALVAARNKRSGS